MKRRELVNITVEAITRIAKADEAKAKGIASKIMSLMLDRAKEGLRSAMYTFIPSDRDVMERVGQLIQAEDSEYLVELDDSEDRKKMAKLTIRW